MVDASGIVRRRIAGGLSERCGAEQPDAAAVVAAGVTAERLRLILLLLLALAGSDAGSRAWAVSGPGRDAAQPGAGTARTRPSAISCVPLVRRQQSTRLLRAEFAGRSGNDSVARQCQKPVAPIQAQDQGVVSLVEKHPSDPAPGQSKGADNRVAPDLGGTASHGRLGPRYPAMDTSSSVLLCYGAMPERDEASIRPTRDPPPGRAGDWGGGDSAPGAGPRPHRCGHERRHAEGNRGVGSYVRFASPRGISVPGHRQRAALIPLHPRLGAGISRVREVSPRLAPVAAGYEPPWHIEGK